MLLNNLNPPFWELNALIKNENDAVNEFAHNTTAIYTKWLQKWTFVPYVFRRNQSGEVT